MNGTHSHRNLYAAALLLLLLAAITIPSLNDQGLWGDEGWSVRFSDGSPRAVTAAVVNDRHPPLYFLMLGGWRALMGDDEVSLRFLSVIHTLLTTAFLFRLGQILYGKADGLAAMLVFTLMDQQVVWAGEVRQYALLMLFTVMSGWALVGVSRYGASRRYRYSYLLAAVGGLYTHNFMILVLVGQLLWALAFMRQQIYRLFLLDLFAGIAFAPWIPVFYYQFTVHGGLRHDLPLTLETARTLTVNFLGEPLALTMGLVLLGLGRTQINAPGWRVNRIPVRALAVPIVSIIFPLALIVSLTLASSNMRLLTDRNLAIILPSLALLVGVGITAFGQFAQRALIIFLLVNGVFTTGAFLRRPPWRAIATYVAAHEALEQPVFLDVGGEDAALSYHLTQELGPSVPQISIYHMEIAGDIEIYSALRFEALPGIEGFWYVAWGGEYHNAFADWGYMRTATAQDAHEGSPITMYRYDSTEILNEQLDNFGGQRLRLHKAYYSTEAEHLRVALWWSTPDAIAENYSISAFLLDDAGRLALQHDSYPAENTAPTSAWTPGRLVYDVHPLLVPDTFPNGEYSVAVKVYRLEDGSILRTSGGEDYRVLGSIRLGE